MHGGLPPSKRDQYELLQNKSRPLDRIGPSGVLRRGQSRISSSRFCGAAPVTWVPAILPTVADLWVYVDDESARQCLDLYCDI